MIIEHDLLLIEARTAMEKQNFSTCSTVTGYVASTSIFETMMGVKWDLTNFVNQLRMLIINLMLIID